MSGGPKEDAVTYPVFEFYKGLTMINAGKRRSGRPHTVLCVESLRVMSEADAKAIVKAYPQMANRCMKITKGDKREKWPAALEKKP